MTFLNLSRPDRASPLGDTHLLAKAMFQREFLLGPFRMEGAVASTTPRSKMALLALTRHSRRWSSLPLETPNATLPQILNKVGTKAHETGASGVPN
jgi:hypothetical protein